MPDREDGTAACSSQHDSVPVVKKQGSYRATDPTSTRTMRDRPAVQADPLRERDRIPQVIGPRVEGLGLTASRAENRRFPEKDETFWREER